MSATFASVWLSRLALLAGAVFAYCAWLVYSLDRESKSNRVALVFNVVFALWAGAASFWYGTSEPSTALFLYRSLAWTWCVFPPLILHFTMRVIGSPVLEGRWRPAFLTCLYAPSVALSVLVPLLVLDDPLYRGGYWMLSIRPNATYFIFVGHYFSLILAAILLAFSSSASPDSKRSGKRFALLGWSYLSAGLLGFVTDTVFLYLGMDFPNMAIFWILILSSGMIVAMRRYGFLSILPAREALSVLESLAEFVVYLNDSGRVIWANPSAVAAIGAASLRHARKATLADFLTSDVIAKLAATAGARPDSRGFRTSLGPGSIPVSLRVHPVPGDETGGIVMTAIDLRPEFATARTERRLADAGNLMDEFMSRSLDGIVLTDTDGRIVRWNQPMVSMTGIGADEALGAFYWDLRSSLEPEGGKAPERLRKSIASVFAGHEPPWTRRILETGIRRRDGSKRIIQNDSFPIPMAEGIILATIARDVTEDRRLAEETIERVRKDDHAQKMEAVGTLSGGIAHDFNNTLAGIMGATSLLRLRMETGDPGEPGEMSRELEIIERASHRAASSVRRLLTLTRKRAPESAVFRLDETVRRVVEFAERSVDQSVRIATRSALPEACVDGDAGQVEQLILNLVINAEQSMTTMRPEGEKRGGIVSLGLQSFKPGRAFLSTNPEAEDRDYWALSVLDEGVGIARHIQNRIFDPFYTTKPRDSSSGLGLAMVHAIVRQHGGFVALRSEPGAGAEFTVYLPCVLAEAAAKSGTTRPHRGDGLVLVVDDDDIPLETATIMLEALGYRTVASSGGEEALRLFAERRDEWKAVLLDLRLGDMAGDAVAVRMRQSRPDIPVVLASGLQDEAADHSFLIESRISMLRKPYTITELGGALEKALGLV